jgi:hypothetical protein
LVLDPHSASSFNVTGNGYVNATAPIIIDSDDSRAAFLVGNAVARSTQVDITGSYFLAGHGEFLIDGAGGVATGVPPTRDPLRFLPPPDPSTMPVRSVAGAVLQPGVYPGGIALSGQTSVTLLPGIYYLAGGGLKVTGQASIQGDGVMIYNDPEDCNHGVQIAGQGSVHLSPMTTGMYRGITLYQNRNSDAGMLLSVGKGSFNATGMFYAAGAEVKIAGNGQAFVGSQFISRILETRGNGEFNVIWDANLAPLGCQ